MLCPRCNKDVHPTRSLWGGSSASTGDSQIFSLPGTFVNRCPICDYGLPDIEPKVVSESVEAALVRLQSEIARLELQGALSPADAELLSSFRAELARIVRRQEALAKPPEAPRIKTHAPIDVGPTPPLLATIGIEDDDDFIAGAKRRLAALEQKLADVSKWEAEARKLRAMIAVADSA